MLFSDTSILSSHTKSPSVVVDPDEKPKQIHHGPRTTHMLLLIYDLLIISQFKGQNSLNKRIYENHEIHSSFSSLLG